MNLHSQQKNPIPESLNEKTNPAKSRKSKPESKPEEVNLKTPETRNPTKIQRTPIWNPPEIHLKSIWNPPEIHLKSNQHLILKERTSIHRTFSIQLHQKYSAILNQNPIWNNPQQKDQIQTNSTCELLPIANALFWKNISAMEKQTWMNILLIINFFK